MRLKRAFWKGAAACGPALRGALWTAALVVLAAVLIVQAVTARDEVRDLAARRAALDRQVERLRGENESLREELHALQNDPVYVESVLRGRRMIGPGERAVK